jgi:putative transposase
MGVVSAIVFFLCAVFRDRADIAAENLALRQQLAVLQVSVKRPRLRKRDRIFWVWLSRIWSGCSWTARPSATTRC